MRLLTYLQAQDTRRKKKILWGAIALCALILLGLWIAVARQQEHSTLWPKAPQEVGAGLEILRQELRRLRGK